MASPWFRIVGEDVHGFRLGDAWRTGAGGGRRGPDRREPADA